jgi:uncharacterized protein involved in outer membrane biogenesis
LVVLIAAAFVVPRFIPADSLKADIAAQVRDATGRDLFIDGDLSFTLLPAPGLSVSGVRLSCWQQAAWRQRNLHRARKICAD